MGEFLKKYPFTIAWLLVMPAAMVWFGVRWWVILVVLFAGLAIGTSIDLRKE